MKTTTEQKRADKALAQYTKDIETQVMQEVMHSLRTDEGIYDAWIVMPMDDADPLLTIGYLFNNEVVGTTTLRDQLLYHFADDPEFYAGNGKIKETVAALRALADEIEAIPLSQ